MLYPLQSPCPDLRFYRVPLCLQFPLLAAESVCSLMETFRPMSGVMDCTPIPIDAPVTWATNSAPLDERAGVVGVATCTRNNSVCPSWSPRVLRSCGLGLLLSHGLCRRQIGMLHLGWENVGSTDCVHTSCQSVPRTNRGLRRVSRKTVRHKCDRWDVYCNNCHPRR